MNYCIVMPRLTDINEQSTQFPIGMAYVSSSLKQTGRNVITYNLTYKSGTTQELLLKLIQENNVDVFITGGLTGQYWRLKEMVDAARAVKPDLIICVGGGIITSSPVPAMEALETVDYGMIGEGEITVCELAEAIEGKKDFHSVDGLIFRENGTWTVTNQRAEIMDLDSLPYPDYEGFEFGLMLDKIPPDELALINNRCGSVSFGRSCPFNCTFCFHPSGTKYRRRSMKSVFQEIDYLIEKFDIHNISVTDELFASNINDTIEFCTEIEKRKIGFAISLRVDMINREGLRLLKDHGCVQISFGLESADNRILKSMNKHITVEQIENALSLCNEVGISAQGIFIFGDEAETVETAHNTIQWWREHPQYAINLSLIKLYPGSILYRHACERGLIKDEVQFIKDGCPFINVSKMTDEDYHNLALEISVLPPIEAGSRDVLEDASVEFTELGKVDYTARCPKCNQFNTWKDQDILRAKGNLLCKHCGRSIHTVIADTINHKADANFQMLKQHKIAIWPMVSAVAELRRVVPSIMEDNVYFIDSAEVKQGGLYYDKPVHAPDIIAIEQIDTAFVTLTTTIASEIVAALKQFPSIKKIFFVGELFDPDFPNRI